MASATADQNNKTLTEMWDFLGTLTPTPSEADLEKLTSFYEPNAICYLSGMEQPPTTNNETLIQAVKTLMTFWAILERKVTKTVAGEEGKLVVNAMENKLRIAGQELEGFHEVEMVTFSKKGRIQVYQLWADPTRIMAVLSGGAKA